MDPTNLPGEPTTSLSVSLCVALGDLNGDQILDIVVGNFALSDPNFAKPNQVWLGNGDGTFMDPVPLPIPPGETRRNSRVVALGDLDDDGTVPAVNANGLPNLDPSGLLLPDLID